MGIGPGTTRITNVANWTGGKVLFRNPDWEGDNAPLDEGLHDFPFGHPPSVPWAWQNAMSFKESEGQEVGYLWRDGWDMYYRAGASPTHKNDGNHIFTHTQRLQEEYVVLGLSPDRCGVLSSQTQLDAIWGNLSKAAIQVLDATGVSAMLKVPELAVQLASDLDASFAGHPEGAQVLADVPAEKWEAALSSISADEYEKINNGDTEAHRRALTHAASILGIVGNVAWVLAGVSAVIAAFATLVAWGTFGTSAGVAIVFAILAGALSIIAGGLGIAQAAIGEVIRKL